jgi:hypothetical protein
MNLETFVEREHLAWWWHVLLGGTIEYRTKLDLERRSDPFSTNLYDQLVCFVSFAHFFTLLFLVPPYLLPFFSRWNPICLGLALNYSAHIPSPYAFIQNTCHLYSVHSAATGFWPLSDFTNRSDPRKEMNVHLVLDQPRALLLFSLSLGQGGAVIMTNS